MIKAITGSNLRRDSQKDGDEQAPTRTRLTVHYSESLFHFLDSGRSYRSVDHTSPKLNVKTCFFCQSWTRSKREKSKTGKIDEHIDAAGIDNMESFIDPSTNLIYYKLKILGKGGFAKGMFCKNELFTEMATKHVGVLTRRFGYF